jgi:hypothetical protein
MPRFRNHLSSWIVVFALVAVFFWIEHRARSAALAEVAALRHSQEMAAREIDRLRQIDRGLSCDATRAQSAAAALKSAAAEQTSRAARTSAAVHGWTRIHYGPLWRKLGLSPSQMDAFDQIATEGQYRLHDLAEAARAEGMASDSPALQNLIRTQNQETEEQEAALLGVQGAATLDEFERASEVRSLLLGLSGNLYDRDPLTPDQTEAAVTVLAGASPSYQSGGGVDLVNLDWPRAQSQLSSVLTPTQLSSLATILNGERGSIDVNLREGAAMKTASPTVP